MSLEGGRPLACREWGQPGAQPLLFWPGLNPWAAAQLDEAGPLLSSRYGLHVMAVEPPGWTTAALEPDEYRPTALARRIVALLDALELERVAFVGYSWGASIGCRLAASSSERLDALVLLDAGYTDLQDQPQFAETTLAEMIEEMRESPLRFESWDAYLDAARARARTWRPALAARARAGMLEREGAILPITAPQPVAAAWYGVMVEPPSSTIEALGKLELPILLVAAADTIAQDWAARALERFRTAVPAADMRVIDDSGHDVLADAPEATITAVGEWLRARLAPS